MHPFRARESAAASREKAREAVERITDIASRLEGSCPSNLLSNHPLLTHRTRPSRKFRCLARYAEYFGFMTKLTHRQSW